ncbi:MAG: hypothetical protein H7Z42_22970 [Roseiflexaceae bacterium]|nr:hypothetical protein [Roseiflexaceae bacterium]
MTTPRTIYVMQSAHTDIGYTHPQEQIRLMYLDHYDQVLDLCRQSEREPEPTRFKWTCETAWQVQHYLTQRPAREAEFLHFVRAGQIEMTATYLHFTDLIDADAYRRSLAWVVGYCRQHELPLRCALHCDINGWPWAVADILAELNIPYFCSQVHIDSGTDPLGRRGSVHYHWQLDEPQLFRPNAPVRIPQAFWWQGPQGGTVLHWLNEHYLLGNMLGVSSPHPFHTDKTRYFLETDRLSVEHLYSRAVREVPRYLERIDADGYPYDIVLLSTGGFFVDNAPPDGRWCEVIARWNAEHTEITMRTATLSEWFAALAEREHGAWPTYQVAWPDHWAHGLGSQTALVAQARRTQRRRADAVAVVDQSDHAGAAAHLATALEQERLAVEHTWNAWSTSTQPASPLNEYQGAAKALTFHRAEMYLDEAIGSALRALVPPSDETALFAHTAEVLATPRVLSFAAGDMQLDPATQQLVDERGTGIPFQRDRAELAQFVAALPPYSAGLRSYRVRNTVQSVSQSQPQTLANAAWQVTVDPQTGGLANLYDKRTGREWVDSNHQYGFGQLVHEAVVHPLGREATHNTARFVALDVASEQLRQRMGNTSVFAHATLAFAGVPHYTTGPVFDELVLHGEAIQIGSVGIHWRLYHALPLVELVLAWDKLWSDVPEAAYVAFPFAVPNGRLDLETGGGFFQPGSHAAGGQLPGTCSTYYTIQRAARITTANSEQLLWLPIDAPLVMTNQLNYNRWETEPYEWNGFLASMPVNHYWHTNFATSQRGHIRLRYRFFSPGILSDEAALQTAMPLEALGWR